MPSRRQQKQSKNNDPLKGEIHSRPDVIEVIARGLILRKGRLLVCWSKHGKFSYLPGGHVEYGESALHTLRRELKEETGATVTSADPLGFFDFRFREGKRLRHEVNLLFRATVREQKLRSKERAIAFRWLTKKELRKAKVLPPPLKRLALRWMD